MQTAVPLVTTLCSAKNYLQIPDSDTTRDKLITGLIPQVSRRFQKYTGRNFGTFTYTDYYSGDGTPVLVLRERPVTAEGLLVWVDLHGAWGQGLPDGTDGTGPFPDSTQLLPGEYALDVVDNLNISLTGLLYRRGAVWPQARERLWLNQSPNISADYRVPTGNVKVVYTAGDLPEDVTLAANMTISAILQSNVHNAPVVSESYEDYSYQLGNMVNASGLDAVIPPRALSILASYRELAF